MKNYDPMCSCATCNHERNNERNNMFNAFKVVALAAGAVLYLSSYLVGSLEVVLGTTITLAALVVSIFQLRDK